MRDETLQLILDKLNTGVGEIIVYTRKLGGNVELGRAVTEIPTPTDPMSLGLMTVYEIYLIKENDKYAGIVLDMTTDLHWYMDPGYRGKGLMKKALIKHILPHLSDNRKDQPITISHDIPEYQTSLDLALSAGFKLISESNASIAELIHYFDYDFDDDYTLHPVTLTAERYDEIKREIYYYHRRLKIIYAECEMGLTEMWGLDEKFHGTIADVLKLTLRIHDKWLDLKEEEEEKLKSN